MSKFSEGALALIKINFYGPVPRYRPSKINFDFIQLINNARQSILKSYSGTAAMPTAWELKAFGVRTFYFIL